MSIDETLADVGERKELESLREQVRTYEDIVREICLLHGGDLSVDNTDAGALVTARLSA